MRRNDEITSKIKLLDSEGNIAEPGFCRRMEYDYSRSDIKANPSRIKEWDFYQILSKDYMVQVMIFDISIGGAVNINVINLKDGSRGEFLTLKPLTFGRLNLPSNTEKPHIIEYRQGGFSLLIECKNGLREITAFKKGSVDCHIKLKEFDAHESLVMAVPFEKKGHFYLNQKMNCLEASGYCSVNSQRAVFNPETDFAVLDWGRGVWPYKCSWYWGNGSTRLPDGRVFGFEIGWGFGDMSKASENMLFIDGKAHKIGEVYMKRDKSDWLKPWYYTSDDGRFEAVMTPVFDNFTSSRVGPIGNVCHQVFGNFNGTAVLDGGEKVSFKDMLAFTEFSDNRW
ncbi:MAG: DUF2804 domain-containing protein [Acutalibacteraceae bacterium]